VSSARLYVCAQGKKRLVMALTYAGEDDIAICSLPI
jgi:hypothetical protein